jgi:hypothetical protein
MDANWIQGEHSNTCSYRKHIGWEEPLTQGKNTPNLFSKKV